MKRRKFLEYFFIFLTIAIYWAFDDTPTDKQDIFLTIMFLGIVYVVSSLNAIKGLVKLNNLTLALLNESRNALERISLRIPDISQTSFDTMLKERYPEKDLLNKKITWIERNLHQLYLASGRAVFSHTLYAILSGRKVHFTFDLEDSMEAVCINIEGKGQNNEFEKFIITELPYQIDEYCFNVRQSQEFGRIQADLSAMEIVEYRINSEKWLFRSGVIEQLKSCFCEDGTTENENVSCEICEFGLPTKEGNDF